MPDAPFDPSGAVTFDLAAGQVELKGSPPRVLVPAEHLCALCEAAGEDATRSLGHAIGEWIGRRALQGMIGAQSPDARVAGLSLERFVEYLAGEFALVGLGAMGLERWGRAMLVMVDHGVKSTVLISAVFEGAIEATTGHAVRCVKLMESGDRRRLLVGSPAMAERVARQVADGKTWGEILVELHGAASAAPARGDA